MFLQVIRIPFYPGISNQEADSFGAEAYFRRCLVASLEMIKLFGVQFFRASWSVNRGSIARSGKASEMVRRGPTADGVSGIPRMLGDAGRLKVS